jgi:sporulation protein YlmC with PRC-barrel domain
MDDGEKVGVVKNLLIDTDALQATAYLLGGPPGQGVLPFDKVKSVGEDAITIESAQLIKWATGQLSSSIGRESSELLKLTVVDGEGTNLGEVQDMEVDLHTGHISTFSVGGGGVFGIGGHTEDLPASAIRAIGPNLITAEHKVTAHKA